MHQVPLEAKVRTEHGKKGAMHRLRRAGNVPAVLYSKGSDNLLLQVDGKSFLKAISHGSNVIVSLQIPNGGGGEHLAMITEIQRDIYQKNILHVDFHKISLKEKVRATVQVSFQGTSQGEKDGGVLDHVRREVELEGLPLSMPEQLEVDVSGLKLDEAIHVKDLKVPEGVTVLTDGNEIVAVVHASRAAVEAPTSEEPGTAQSGAKPEAS
ncbi:MAG: 50S ribosomal protein L25 [Armatimonadetes bacterium]|nr:50S ribosomal protein L25 [Armatimonadota bacterium]